MKPRVPAAVPFFQGLGVNFGFLIFMLVFVLGMAASTGYGIYRLRAKAIDEHGRIAAMHARAIEDHLTQSLTIVSQTLENLAEAELLGARAGRRFASALLTSPALRSLSLLDADDRVIASSNPRNIGKRLDTLDYLPVQTSEGEFMRIGRPWAGRDFGDGTPPSDDRPPLAGHLGFVPALRAVEIGGRRFTLAAALNPDYFINHYGARLGTEEGFVDVLRYDGTGLLATEPRPAREGAHAGFLRQLADVEFGDGEATLEDGTRVLMSFRASRSFPLVVVTHVRLDYALAEWAAESRRLLFATVPTLLGAVLLTTLLFVHLRRIEEQQAEARQREHDRLAATVFRTVDGGVVVADADDRVVAVNPGFSRITGYEESEVVGRMWQKLLGDEVPGMAKEIATALRARGSWHGEIRHRHRNGERYVAWLSVNLVRNEDDAVTYKVAAFSDITDRKRAEEAQVHAIIEASPEAVLLVDDGGRIIYANGVCQRDFGYSADELSGMDVNELVPAPQRMQHRRFVQEYAREPRARPMRSGLHLTALRRDGGEFPVEISLSPIDMGGRLVVIVSISDITQRIRDEAALRASEERWKFALEGAGEGVWDWNVTTGDCLFSKRILDFWNCAEAASGRLTDWTSRIHPDDQAFVMAQVDECLAGTRPTCAVEHRVRRQDGSWHWALARGMVFSRDGQGQPLRVIGTYADVTQRKTVENELKAAKEAAEALLRRASLAERHIIDISERTQERIGQELHDDLGQHLTGAAFLSEILFRKLEALKQAEMDDAARITRLINDAVAKTRTLAQGLYPVELKEAGLHTMLRQLTRNVELTYEIQCRFHADEDNAINDPGVAINLFRITQEAINNAVRHGKASHIDVRLTRQDGATLLAIEDDGCGIAAAASTAGGLGMHTMRYRAALVGASLDIVAGAHGGTKVVIALPLSEETDADSVQSAA